MDQAGADQAPAVLLPAITLTQTGTVNRWGKHRPVFAVLTETGDTAAHGLTFKGALTFARTLLTWRLAALLPHPGAPEWETFRSSFGC